MILLHVWVAVSGHFSRWATFGEIPQIARLSIVSDFEFLRGLGGSRRSAVFCSTDPHLSTSSCDRQLGIYCNRAIVDLVVAVEALQSSGRLLDS